MKCSELKELLSAYANDELARTQREFVEEHLSSCADCRETLADYTEIRQKLISLRTAPSGSNIKETAMSRIKTANASERPTWRWKRPAFVTAPIAIVLVILLALHPWSTSPNPMGVIAEAHAATTGVQSYRMIASTTNTIDGEISEDTSEVEFAAGDRYHIRMTTDGQLREFIIIGDEQYIYELPSEHSSEHAVIIMTTSSVGASIPDKEGVLAFLNMLADPDELPDEKIDDVDCFHYLGMVDFDRIVDEQAASLDPDHPDYEDILRSLEQQRKSRIEVELWIGKDDYLLRQIRVDAQSLITSSDSKGSEQERWAISSSLAKYYDFNESIEIEPPVSASGDLLPGWHLESHMSAPRGLASNIMSEISGDDPAHRQISYSIDLMNVGDDVARDVQVLLSVMATSEEPRPVMMEAEPSSPGPVDLEPGESETYEITWEYDSSDISEEELAHIVGFTTILVRQTTPEGDVIEEPIGPQEYTPYPTKVPPPQSNSPDDVLLGYVTIQADRDTYTPIMSSTVGIGLTPMYTSEESPSETVRFHWHTNYGHFVSWGPPDFKVELLGKDVINNGEKIYWSYSPDDMDAEKPTVEISLSVEDAQSGQVPAGASLEIGWEDQNTAVTVPPFPVITSEAQ